MSQQDRGSVIDGFLDQHGWGSAGREKLVDDASARKYFRLGRGFETALLMDFPPNAVSIDPHGVSDIPERLASIAPVLQTTTLFTDLGWRVPEVLAHDVANGLALIEDFGDLTFTRALAMGSIVPASLYIRATDALITLHRGCDAMAAGAAGVNAANGANGELSQAMAGLVTYQPANLRRQLASFGRDYLPLVIADDARRGHAMQEFDDLLDHVLPQCFDAGQTIIHRDYHVDNLMLVDTDDGDADCGIIDFQDAAIGPRPYDLVSLLRDVRHDVGIDIERTMMARYLAAFPEIDETAFNRAYIATGMVRNFRILGRFGWLARESGKMRYLEFVPRCWELILRGAQQNLPELADWVENHIPASARLAPVIPNDHSQPWTGK
ncbi:aminoglycoside phosphotransferase family protein [Thalassospira marina]|uniref:Aminoglycoside phosphotransferase n=1 Tax=Thalassospira marina TaxID=2048283 RepID=A0ABM6QCY1_9PROT|nr:phosphotransferase [Thalassospira marina]AUG54431.1 aminoglycoside phosphotransferase [Thalassospira marina]